MFIQSFKWYNDGFNLKCCSFPSFNVFILNGVQSTNLMCKPSESCHQLSDMQLHHLMQLYHLSKMPSAPYTVLHPLAAGSRNQLSILQNFFVKDWCRFCILFAFLLLLQFTLPLVDLRSLQQRLLLTLMYMLLVLLAAISLREFQQWTFQPKVFLLSLPGKTERVPEEIQKKLQKGPWYLSLRGWLCGTHIDFNYMLWLDDRYEIIES